MVKGEITAAGIMLVIVVGVFLFLFVEADAELLNQRATLELRNESNGETSPLQFGKWFPTASIERPSTAHFLYSVETDVGGSGVVIFQMRNRSEVIVLNSTAFGTDRGTLTTGLERKDTTASFKIPPFHEYRFIESSNVSSDQNVTLIYEYVN